MLLSIDPGIDTAWAMWRVDGSLHSCELSDKWHTYMVTRAIIECPQVYPGTPAKQANDLITLAVMVGRYQAHFMERSIPVTLVPPHKWKGATPKDIHNARVLGRLTDAERTVYHKASMSLPASKRHNVIDSIGIGLYALKRLVPGQG